MCGAVLVAVLMAAGPDEVLREFQARVEAYVPIHRALETHTPPRTVTRDVAQIRAAADALAGAIIAARPNALQGDIFSPAVAAMFRERFASALADVNIDHYLDYLFEGEDFRMMHAAVHARDPYSRVPLGLPVNLLRVLPDLPSELEDRLVGRDLALWDEHAAMVIDFIPNVVPEQSAYGLLLTPYLRILY